MFARHVDRPAWRGFVDRSAGSSRNFRCSSSRPDLALECEHSGIVPGCVRMFVGFRPQVHVQYEHMFPRTTQHPLTRRARWPKRGLAPKARVPRLRSIFARPLSLARSFLLLEDDYDVDWEVDQDESGRGDTRGRGDAATEPHPHRSPLPPGDALPRTSRPAGPGVTLLCVARSTAVTSVHQHKRAGARTYKEFGPRIAMVARSPKSLYTYSLL